MIPATLAPFPRKPGPPGPAGPLGSNPRTGLAFVGRQVAPVAPKTGAGHRGQGLSP